MYEPVIFKACGLVALIQNTRAVTDTNAAAKHPKANPRRDGTYMGTTLSAAINSRAITRIFHRVLDSARSAPSVKIETNT